MTKTYQFHAVIEDAGGGGAYVTIPFDVEETFSKKRVKIKAIIDGEAYRGTLVRMGGPQHLLPVLKEIRNRIGKNIGDDVFVELEEDLEPRQVMLTPDIQLALDENSTAYDHFNQLSYTHQKEYINWILEAKRNETRRRRIQQMIAMLEQGKRGH